MKGFEVVVLKNKEEAVQRAAAMIAAQIGKRKHSVVGLASGRTFVPVYKEIVAMHKNGILNFSKITTFNLDEYVGLNGKDKDSIRRYMDNHLFKKVNLTKENIHFLDGRAQNFDDECTKYEGEIAEAGGIDFQILGLGVDAHIGYDEPGSSLKSRTHQVELTRSTRKAVAGFFKGNISNVPRFGLTMGIGTIMEAKEILLVAFGEDKTDAVRCMLKGKISKNCPASVLRRHGKVTILLDRAAAAKL